MSVSFGLMTYVLIGAGVLFLVLLFVAIAVFFNQGKDKHRD